MPSADPVDAPACAARTTFRKESTAPAERTVLAMAAVLQLLGPGRLRPYIAQHGRENALRRQIGAGQLARHLAPIEHDDAVTHVDQLGDVSRVEEDAFAGSGVIAHQ